MWMCVKVIAAVQPVREKLNACCIFPSMPAVMKLNKLGSFSMGQLGQKKSIFGELIKNARNNDKFEESLLKVVRTLPKILQFLPMEKARDARNFVMSIQYWLGGNTDNLENFLLTISQAYVPELKDANIPTQEPQLFPDVGIWHPLAPNMYEDVKEYLNWYDTRKDLSMAKGAPVIGLVLQRSHLVTGDEGHYTGVVSELEALGAKVQYIRQLQQQSLISLSLFVKTQNAAPPFLSFVEDYWNGLDNREWQFSAGWGVAETLFGCGAVRPGSQSFCEVVLKRVKRALVATS